MKVLLVLTLVVCAVEANRKCWKCIQSDSENFSDEALEQYNLPTCSNEDAAEFECPNYYDRCFSSNATVTYNTKKVLVTSRGCTDKLDHYNPVGWTCSWLEKTLGTGVWGSCEDQYCEMDLCETDEWFSGTSTLTISSLLVALTTALAL